MPLIQVASMRVSLGLYYVVSRWYMALPMWSRVHPLLMTCTSMQELTHQWERRRFMKNSAATLSRFSVSKNCTMLWRVAAIVPAIPYQELVWQFVAPLSQTAGTLILKHTRVTCNLGATETACLQRLAPAIDDWAYFYWHPTHSGIEMLEAMDGMYELFLVKPSGFEVIPRGLQ